MKTRCIHLVVLLCLPFMFFAQGIQFFEGTWEEALVRAKEEKKLIFVDAYAQWCGPCKMMAKKVFTQPEVGEFYNSNFINMKLDMEASESKSFKRKFSVSAFPTLFFVNEKEEEVHKSVGAKKADALIALGNKALSKDDRSGEFAEKYALGDRSYDLVLAYVKALNKVNKPSLGVVNEYLRSNPEITPEQRAIFVFEGITESDSKWFSELLNNRKMYVKRYGEEAVEEKIQNVCWKTVEKAAEFEYYGLVEESKTKYKSFKTGDDRLFGLEADMYYGGYMKDPDIFMPAIETYYKKYAKKEPTLIKQCIEELSVQFKDNEKAKTKAENYSKELVKKEKTPENLLIYAQILNKNGKKSDAIVKAKESLELAKKEGQPGHKIQQFIRFLESS